VSAAKVKLKRGGEDRDGQVPGAMSLRDPTVPIDLMVVAANIMPIAPTHVPQAPRQSWQTRRAIHAAWTGMATG